MAWKLLNDVIDPNLEHQNGAAQTLPYDGSCIVWLGERAGVRRPRLSRQLAGRPRPLLVSGSICIFWPAGGGAFVWRRDG